MPRLLSLALMAMLSCGLAGCAGCAKENPQDTLDTSYKVLATIGIAYDTNMRVATELRQQGLIPDDKWDNFKDTSVKAYNAYQAACTALLQYYNAVMKTDGSTEQITAYANQALTEAQTAFNEFITEAEKCGIKTLPANNDTNQAEQPSKNATQE